MKKMVISSFCLLALACGGNDNTQIAVDAGRDARRETSVETYTCEPFDAPTTAPAACLPATVACLNTAADNAALNSCLTRLEPTGSRQACITCLNAIEPNCAARAIPDQAARDRVACVFSCLAFKCPTSENTCFQAQLQGCVTETGATQANLSAFFDMCTGDDNRFSVCQIATDAGVDSATTDSATTDSATTDSATTDSATTDSAATDSATTTDSATADAETNG